MCLLTMTYTAWDYKSMFENNDDGGTTSYEKKNGLKEKKVLSTSDQLQENKALLSDYMQQNASLRANLTAKEIEFDKQRRYTEKLRQERDQLTLEKAHLQEEVSDLLNQKSALQVDIARLMIPCIMFTNDVYPYVSAYKFPDHISPQMKSQIFNGLNNVEQQRVSPLSSQFSTSNLHHSPSNASVVEPHISSTLEMKLRTAFCSSDVGPNFSTPQGIAIGIDSEIVIADTNNHRCLVVDATGKYLKTVGTSGIADGNVYFPRKVVTVPREGSCRYIVLDRGPNNHFNRLQEFDNKGDFICRFIWTPMAVEQINAMTINKDNCQLVLFDNKNSVLSVEMTQTPCLRIVQAFSTMVQEASDIVVFEGFYYITDYKAHLVVVYNEKGTFIQKFGGVSFTPYPIGIDISLAGDVMVANSHGNHFHVVIFNSKGEFQQDYKCLDQKVSRCMGLKVTSEGHLVSLNRQNGSVLVFNKLSVDSTSFD